MGNGAGNNQPFLPPWMKKVSSPVSSAPGGGGRYGMNQKPPSQAATGVTQNAQQVQQQAFPSQVGQYMNGMRAKTQQQGSLPTPEQAQAATGTSSTPAPAGQKEAGVQVYTDPVFGSSEADVVAAQKEQLDALHAQMQNAPKSDIAVQRQIDAAQKAKGNWSGDAYFLGQAAKKINEPSGVPQDLYQQYEQAAIDKLMSEYGQAAQTAMDKAAPLGDSMGPNVAATAAAGLGALPGALGGVQSAGLGKQIDAYTELEGRKIGALPSLAAAESEDNAWDFNKAWAYIENMNKMAETLKKLGLSDFAQQTSF